MYTDGVPNHTNPLLSKYKMQLTKSALEELGDTGSTAAKPPPVPITTENTKEEEEPKEDPFFASISVNPAAIKISSAAAPTSSSIYSFTNLKTENHNATLNAKKLDIDFGGDDFFDSFGMTNNDESKDTKITSNDNPFIFAGGDKKDEPGPFLLGSGMNSNNQTSAQDDAFIKKKLKELEGKKAISSDDFKQLEKDEYKDRFARFSGATAISSADFFAEEKKDDSQGRASIGSLGSFNRDSFGDKVSEAAVYAADKVVEGAKKLKEKASAFWGTLRSSDASTK